MPLPNFSNETNQDFSFTKPIIKTAGISVGMYISSQTYPWMVATGLTLATGSAPALLVGISMGTVYYMCKSAPIILAEAIDMLYEIVDKSATTTHRQSLNTQCQKLITAYNNDYTTLQSKLNELFTEYGITQTKLEQALQKIDLQNFQMSMHSKRVEFFTTMDSLDTAFNLASFTFPTSEKVARIAQCGHIGTHIAKIAFKAGECGKKLSGLEQLQFSADMASLVIMMIGLFTSSDSAMKQQIQALFESIETLHKDMMTEFSEVKKMLNMIFREVLNIKWSLKELEFLLRTQGLRLEKLIFEQHQLTRRHITDLKQYITFQNQKNHLLTQLEIAPTSTSEIDLLNVLYDCVTWGLTHSRKLPELVGPPTNNFSSNTTISLTLHATDAKNCIGYLFRYYYRDKENTPSTPPCNPEALIQAAESFVHLIGRYHATHQYSSTTIIKQQLNHNKYWLVYMAAIMVSSLPITRRLWNEYMATNLTIRNAVNIVQGLLQSTESQSSMPMNTSLLLCGIIPTTGILGCSVIQKIRNAFFISPSIQATIMVMLNHFYDAMVNHFEFLKSLQTDSEFLNSLVANYLGSIAKFESLLDVDDSSYLRTQVKNLNTNAKLTQRLDEIDSCYWLCRRFLELAFPHSSMVDPILTTLFPGYNIQNQSVFSGEMLSYHLQQIDKKYTNDTAFHIACRELLREVNLYAKILEKLVSIKLSFVHGAEFPLIECDAGITEGASILRELAKNILGENLVTKTPIPVSKCCLVETDIVIANLDHTNNNDIMIACHLGTQALGSLVKKGATLTAKDSQPSNAHFAAFYDNISLVEYLIEKNVDIHHVDNDQNTALHYAAAGQAFLAIPFLIQAGLNHKKQNKKGENAQSLLPTELHVTFEKCVGMATNGQLNEYKKARRYAQDNDIPNAIICYQKLLSGDDKALANARAALEHACNCIRQTANAINDPHAYHYSKKAKPGLRASLEKFHADKAHYQKEVQSKQPELPEPWKYFLRKQINTLTTSLKALEKHEQLATDDTSTSRPPSPTPSSST